MCGCVRACARARVRACVRVRVCMCVCSCVFECLVIIYDRNNSMQHTINSTINVQQSEMYITGGWDALRKVGGADGVSFTIEEESRILDLHLGMLRRDAFICSL